MVFNVDGTMAAILVPPPASVGEGYEGLLFSLSRTWIWNFSGDIAGAVNILVVEFHAIHWRIL